MSNMVGGSRQRDNFPGMHCEKRCVGVVEIQFISIFSLRNTKNVHTILPPKNWFCYLVLNLVASLLPLPLHERPWNI